MDISRGRLAVLSIREYSHLDMCIPWRCTTLGPLSTCFEHLVTPTRHLMRYVVHSIVVNHRLDKEANPLPYLQSQALDPAEEAKGARTEGARDPQPTPPCECPRCAA